ncbi:ankyrin repeat domain-containing protein SOWAHA [Varanus komodoensis]|uniref:ankyrin repeat domain-containing protein SOWAHA n=1 Tax=Varanus komodoensis TaxID=61221 RepID=UPI001CF7C964|nr:ankyrin repeat domain-containing protein SOWAHA [Varanus komodoensis]
MAVAAPALSRAGVARFLRERGGAVRVSLLVSHFAPLLEAPAGERGEPAELRERFEGFVNDVAVVRRMDGAEFLVLKPAAHAAGARPCDAEGEEEEGEGEEGEGAAPPAPAPHAVVGAPARDCPEESQAALPVAKLKDFFQGGDPEPPKAPGGSALGSARAAPQKPCMLPVRYVVPASARGRGAEEPRPEPEPEPPAGAAWRQVGQVGPRAATRSASPQRKQEPAESGPSSPPLRRAPKPQKVGEEADGPPPTVPLEAAEHEWLVSATAGQWSPRLHGLLLHDRSLASKRDFMTGFTVLHWAAKTGNCDMLQKVIEVARADGAHFDVNAQSFGGYTPLHIAALHGQEDVIVQLVKDYNAKVSLRDYSGKKPFQYLREGSSFAVRHLLRDPNLHTVSGQNTFSKKNAKVAASILSSTSTVLGLLSDDTAFYELTKGLKKTASLNRLLHAATASRRRLKSKGSFSSYSSLVEAVEEEQEETTVKRRPVSELFFGH